MAENIWIPLLIYGLQWSLVFTIQKSRKSNNYISTGWQIYNISQKRQQKKLSSALIWNTRLVPNVSFARYFVDKFRRSYLGSANITYPCSCIMKTSLKKSKIYPNSSQNHSKVNGMIFISGSICLDLSQIWLDFSKTWLAFSQYGWISPDGLPFIFLYFANGSGTSRKIPAFGLWSFLELRPWELPQPHTGISLYSPSLVKVQAQYYALLNCSLLICTSRQCTVQYYALLKCTLCALYCTSRQITIFYCTALPALYLGIITQSWSLVSNIIRE